MTTDFLYNADNLDDIKPAGVVIKLTFVEAKDLAGALDELPLNYRYDYADLADQLQELSA